MPYYAPSLRTYTSDLLSALRHHPALHAYLLTNRCSAKLILAIAGMWVLLKQLNLQLSQSMSTLFPDNKQQSNMYDGEGDIRPEDVREVFLSCVGHRLRMREESERLSNFWNASKYALSDEKGVGDIVQEILKTV